MRCLVTGAYGFIGKQVVQALQADGWSVVGAGRDLALGRRLLPDIEWISCDFNFDLDARDWAGRLQGIDAVVNCVGILQSTAKDNAQRIHGQAAAALFAGAEEAGVKRLIHISAMSAETNVPTQYAKTKRAGELALQGSDINWLIIKPSLVIGNGSFGGTSLIRGIAGLPFIMPLPGTGAERFQPIALSDLATGIASLLSKETPSKTTLYAAGPDTLTVKQIIKAVRRWLGFTPAITIALPKILMKPILWLGDLAGWFGQPSAMRSTSLQQMTVNEIADPKPFQQATGIKLTSFADIHLQTSSTLQDRLHARTYFAEPVLRLSLIMLWVLTGFIALTPSGFASATQILTGAGLLEPISQKFVLLGALTDIALGAAMLNQRWLRWAGLGQIMLTLTYLMTITFLRPDLWADPLGPILKSVPLIGAALIVMAFAEER